MSDSQVGDLAITLKYTLNNWQGLNRYIEDVRYTIDNNPAGLKMRNIFVGRKNYLFFAALPVVPGPRSLTI